MQHVENIPLPQEALEFLSFRAVLEDLRESDPVGLQLLKQIVKSVATKPCSEAEVTALTELIDPLIDRRERLIAAAEFLEGRA